MKITVIYGDNLAVSYKRFAAIVDVVHKRGWEIIHLEDQSSIIESFTAASLFENNKLYIFEDISKIKPIELTWLKENLNNLEGNLLIFNEGAIPKKLSSVLPKSTKLEEFKLPKVIFSFLESLYPGNAKEALRLLHQAAKTDAIELIFSLMGTHFRDLYYQADSMPAWKKGKLTKQAQKYTPDKIKTIIAELAKIDIAVKTSQQELLPSLDLLIARELQ